MDYQSLVAAFLGNGGIVTYCEKARYRRNTKYRRSLKSRPVAFYKGLV